MEVNLEDPATMQATIQHLVGMVSSMQGDIGKRGGRLAITLSSAAPCACACDRAGRMPATVPASFTGTMVRRPAGLTLLGGMSGA